MGSIYEQVSILQLSSLIDKLLWQVQYQLASYLYTYYVGDYW